MARILILGGGFGGLAAAKELRSILPDGDEIVLLSASDRFFMGFAKLWDLAGLRTLDGGTRSLTSLAERGIRFLQTTVTAIDPASLSVETTGGDLTGDALLIALGSVPSPRHLALVAAGSGHNLYDAGQLPAMHTALAGIDAGRVVVAILGGPFKCPPAPYEAALLVDELLRARGVRHSVTVDLVTPQPMTLPAAGPDASRLVAGYLADRGIGLLDRHVIVDVADHSLHFEAGEQIDYSVLLAVPAEQVPPVVAASGLVGPSGFIEPDRHSLGTSYPGTYAVGDCTMIPTATAQLPKAGVFAAAQARVAARNIASDLHGGERATFDGHGACFLEVPGRRVAMVEGNFYAEPKPDITLTEATEANFDLKAAYERDRLAEWLG